MPSCPGNSYDSNIEARRCVNQSLMCSVQPVDLPQLVKEVIHHVSSSSRWVVLWVSSRGVKPGLAGLLGMLQKGIEEHSGRLILLASIGHLEEWLLKTKSKRPKSVVLMTSWRLALPCAELFRQGQNLRKPDAMAVLCSRRSPESAQQIQEWGNKQQWVPLGVTVVPEASIDGSEAVADVLVSSWCRLFCGCTNREPAAADSFLLSERRGRQIASWLMSSLSDLDETSKTWSTNVGPSFLEGHDHKTSLASLDDAMNLDEAMNGSSHSAGAVAPTPCSCPPSDFESPAQHSSNPGASFSTVAGDPDDISEIQRLRNQHMASWLLVGLHSIQACCAAASVVPMECSFEVLDLAMNAMG